MGTQMKLSTGNQINGKIMEIRKGAVTAIVYVDTEQELLINGEKVPAADGATFETLLSRASA